MLKIKVGKMPWVTLIYIFAILVAVFSEQRVLPKTTLLSYAATTVDDLGLKYLFESFAIAVGVYVYMLKYRSFNISRLKMRREAGYALLGIGVITAITLIFQIKNGFLTRSYKELILLLLPVIFVFTFVNVAEDGIELLFDCVFFLFVALFIGYRGRSLTISNILAIDFIKSHSPFESPFSFMGCFLVQYYLYRNKKIKAFICLVITTLSFKRIAMLYCILLFIFYRFVPRYKKVNPIIVKMVVVIFIIVPSVFIILCNDDFASWFYKTFDMDLNRFMMGRYERLNLVADSDGMKYGLGSTTEYITRVYADVRWRKTGISYNLHNDICRIYLETTIVGSFFFTWTNFKLAEMTWPSFLLMLYMFIDMMFNHLTGLGTATFWITVFMMIYYFNRQAEIHSLETAEASACS